MKTTFTTAAAVFLATAITASAMGTNTIVQNEIIGFGYDAEIVKSLTDAQLSTLSQALHSGEDSEARGAVRSLMLNFSK